MNFLIIKKKKNECLDDVFVFLSSLLSLRLMLKDLLLDPGWNRKLLLIVYQILKACLPDNRKIISHLVVSSSVITRLHFHIELLTKNLHYHLMKFLIRLCFDAIIQIMCFELLSFEYICIKEELE